MNGTRGWWVAVASVLGLALAGCGSSSSSSTHSITNVTAKPTTTASGGKQFSAPGMAIHFQYPSNFRVIPLAASKRVAGNNTKATHAAVGIGNYDLLIITRFPGLPVAVTSSNIGGLKSQFDSLMGQVFGRKMSGTVGTAGGLPAIKWPRVPTVGLPVKASTQAANVFAGNDEYEIQCQATPKNLGAIEAACNQLFATLSSSK